MLLSVNHVFSTAMLTVDDVVLSFDSGNGLVSYYIDSVLTSVGVTDPGIKSEINGGLQIWNLLCAFSAALLVDKLGRRTLFIISNVGMLIGQSHTLISPS